MSDLVHALNRCMRWIEDYLPEYANSFLPGLTFDEILEALETLGFAVSDEVYELYQWRNGAELDIPSFVFPAFEFIPIRQVIEVNEQIESDQMVRDLFTFNDQPLLPFMQRNGRYCSIILSQKSTLNSPVVYIGKQGGEPYIAFSSLTSMMISLAECFETRAYYLDENSYIDVDDSKLARILRKHNSELVEIALSEARVLLTDFQYTYEMNIFISKVLQALERFRPPSAIAILSEALPRYSLDQSRKNLLIRSQIAHTLQVIQTDPSSS
jgi:hypothetical protein